jgi:Transposase DDE domain
VTKRRKQQYRVRNWRDYNKALVSRGSLTVWIDTRSTDAWLDRDTPPRRGRRRTYADVAILCALTLREVYHLPLRATEGLVSSVLGLLEVELPAPDYSTLCRRARSLGVPLSAPARRAPLHLVVDSTGLKVYGEGEWKVRLHGYDKRRTWRKLHLAIDHRSQRVVATSITDKDVLDRRAVPELLSQIEGRVSQVLGDGAYDYAVCYEAIAGRGARAVIPPKARARLWGKPHSESRDENVEVMRRVGLEQWKQKADYHRRSLVETAMMRLKTIFSDKLKSRTFDRQEVEARIKCAALNRMAELGMPRSYAV